MHQNPEAKLAVYSDLMKYKLSVAVAFSAGTGYFLHSNSFDPGLFPLMAGTFLLASGSAVLNQYTEREQDSVMNRTCGRPVPSGRITLASAKLLYSVLLIAGSCLLLMNGVIPFALGALNVVLYNLVYTSLKKITSLAIIPGALVGAIPPLIGFASAGGTVLSLKILLFSTFMFLWQIPHFWLLLIRYGKEYRNAGFITISDYLNEKQIKNIVFVWILLTSLLLMLFIGFTDIFGRYFSYLIFFLNPVFIVFFSRLLFSPKESYRFRGAFIILNVFGILIMFLLIADSLLAGT